MQKTAERSAVDVAPRRARPGLALLLALLSIPGSTLAWGLPSGGFWIGLPLAVAAIVLGLRARRQLASEAGARTALVAVAIASAMVGMMAVWTIASLVS
ncbi:MAG TPA: hypothetical protein VK506_01845 [Conexibacter sp.]|nr:hypothetical protein [Conexibacter sp.]